MLMKLPEGLPGFPRIAIHDGVEWGCVFSEDSEDAPYRYALWRIWDPDKPIWMYVMMNPADATHKRSDNTVTRCTNRARQNGAGGIVVVNSGAFREKNAGLARAQKDPVGIHNEDWVRSLVPKCDVHIAAWGEVPLSSGAHAKMKQIFHDQNIRLVAIRLNQDGSPTHPSREGGYGKLLVPFVIS